MRCVVTPLSTGSKPSSLQNMFWNGVKLISRRFNGGKNLHAPVPICLSQEFFVFTSSEFLTQPANREPDQNQWPVLNYVKSMIIR